MIEFNKYEFKHTSQSHYVTLKYLYAFHMILIIKSLFISKKIDSLVEI